MNRFLVVLALLFEVVAVAWGFVFHLQAHTLNQFFEQPQWPMFIGIILLLVAVFNGLLRPRVKKPEVIEYHDKDHLPPVV